MEPDAGKLSSTAAVKRELRRTMQEHLGIEEARELVREGKLQAALAPAFGPWIESRSALRAIRTIMRRSQFVVIEDALPKATANAVWEALRSWPPERYELVAESYPRYQFHLHSAYIPKYEGRREALMDTDAWPTPISKLIRLFDSRLVKLLMSVLSGENLVDGDLSGGFSDFRTHDYIGPHSDWSVDPGENQRRIAFVLQLSMNWNNTWGGDFVWGNPFTFVHSGFNRLLLFPVSEHSVHFVSPVTIQVCGIVIDTDVTSSFISLPHTL